mgnify:FL=1
MSVIGIVCEFNPFHKGHKYLIDAVKKDGDTVVCVMSGNFVQRGEPAIFSKEVRVKSALLNGADIVLELPFVYATASAEIFAHNAAKILNDFGCDKIAFGTENADVSTLEKTVEILNDNAFDTKIKKCLEDGVSYPVARQRAFDEYNMDFDISTPNNILALEYMKALKKLNSKMVPMPITRIGAGYNDTKSVDGIASATHIRQLIESNKGFSQFIPENIIEIYNEEIKKGNFVSKEKYNLASLSLLRSKLNEDLSCIANMAEGLENRIKYAIKESTSLDEIFDKAKTKRFTHSRIRRAVLSLTLGVTADDIKIPVPYCRLLGFNINSAEIMGKLASNSEISFVASYSDILNLKSNDAEKVFNIENNSRDFYSLIMQNSVGCSKEMTFSPIKMQ